MFIGCIPCQTHAGLRQGCCGAESSGQMYGAHPSCQLSPSAISVLVALDVRRRGRQQPWLEIQMLGHALLELLGRHVVVAHGDTIAAQAH